MISAVGVVVPARDEQRRIGRCMRALLVALRALPPSLDGSVCVVADRCRDDTAGLAGAVLGSGRVVVNHADRTIGEVRDLGCRHVLTMLSRLEPAEVLLLCTDADSVVAPDWASEHVRMIDSGVHATAGTIELAGRPALPPLVAERYTAVVADAGGPEGHGNVYGANLGGRRLRRGRVGGGPRPVAAVGRWRLPAALCRRTRRADQRASPRPGTGRSGRSVAGPARRRLDRLSRDLRWTASRSGSLANRTTVGSIRRQVDHLVHATQVWRSVARRSVLRHAQFLQQLAHVA
jgi:hypothetical protein